MVSQDAPWFDYPASPNALKKSQKHAIIIGGGLAGCSAASALAGYGVSVQLLECNNAIASQASGNPRAIIHPFLASDWNDQTQLSLAGYRHMVDLLSKWNNEEGFHPCGTLHFASSTREARRFEKLPSIPQYAEVMRYVSAQQASEIAAMAVDDSALYFPDSGWVSLPLLCEYLTANNQIDCITNKTVQAIEKLEGDRWQVTDQCGTHYEADYVVLASAALLHQYDESLHCQSIAGQISFLPNDERRAAPKAVISGNGFVTPAHAGMQLVGATYGTRHAQSIDHAAHHQKNLATYQRLTGQVFDGDHAELEHWCGVRSVTFDRMPLVGLMPDLAFYTQHYGDLYMGRHWQSYPQGAYMSGLYVTSGHGSRGLSSCSLAGEYIARHIMGEPIDDLLDPGWLPLWHPARFLIRHLRKHPTHREG